MPKSQSSNTMPTYLTQPHIACNWPFSAQLPKPAGLPVVGPWGAFPPYPGNRVLAGGWSSLPYTQQKKRHTMEMVPPNHYEKIQNLCCYLILSIPFRPG